MNGGDGAHEDNPQHEGGQKFPHQGRYQGGLGDILKRGDPGQLQHLAAHALEGGEVKQGKADHEGGHEGLLPGQGLGAFDAEGPHGERRRALNAHQGEHVGQNHHGRPGAFTGRPAQPEVDHPGHLQQLGVQVGHRGRKTGPTAELRLDDDVKPQDNDAGYQQHELDDPDPGAGLETAGANVEPDDEGHENTAEDHRHAGDDVEQRRRGHQLHRRVEDRIKDRCGNHQPAQGFTVEVVCVHVARGDEAVALAQQPGALGEKGAGDGNRQHVEGGEGVGQPIAPDQARVADKGPPRKRGRRRRQQKGEKRNGPPGDRVARGGLFSKVAFQPPIEAVDDVYSQKDVNPRGVVSGHKVVLLCVEIRLERLPKRLLIPDGVSEWSVTPFLHPASAGPDRRHA